MMRIAFSLAVSTLLLTGGSLWAAKPAGPLGAYVAENDASYRWVVRRHGKLGSTEWAELILTSQTWRGITWKHQLFVLKPSTCRDDTTHAMLHIAGGSWRDELEDPAEEGEGLPGEARIFAALAEQLQTPLAVLLHVPHQPMFDGLYEDQIISLTFAKYFDTGDAQWPLLLPMVKSAVRAMDATTEFAADKWSLELESFTVTGASKRGWTTWLTGAVDSRAVALAPIVIDVLDLSNHLKHQLATWGEYSPRIHDYTDRDLPKYLDSPAGKSLAKIVDPYSYRERLTQPKLIVIGTNDPYWPLDALNLYWKDLKGDNYILYVPNNGHGLSDFPRVLGSLNALHQHVAAGKRLPRLDWSFENSDHSVTLTITSDIAADRVRVWTAVAQERDFRKAEFRPMPAEKRGDNMVATLELPAEGHLAVFGEAMYNEDEIPYYFSTNVKVFPAAE